MKMNEKLIEALQSGAYHIEAHRYIYILGQRPKNRLECRWSRNAFKIKVSHKSVNLELLIGLSNLELLIG